MKKKTISIIVIVVVILLLAVGTILPQTVALRMKLFAYRVSDQLGNAVGVSLGVPSNEYNKLAQELSTYEKNLQEREGDIALREQDVAVREEEVQKETRALIYASLFGVILLGLILLNFYMDWKRRRRSSAESTIRLK